MTFVCSAPNVCCERQPQIMVSSITGACLFSLRLSAKEQGGDSIQRLRGRFPCGCRSCRGNLVLGEGRGRASSVSMWAAWIISTQGWAFQDRERRERCAVLSSYRVASGVKEHTSLVIGFKVNETWGRTPGIRSSASYHREAMSHLK